MMAEALGALGGLAALLLVGLGPATRLVAPSPKRLAYVIGLAPAVGYALMALLSFPLVRYLAPARVWAWPATLFLMAVSLALVALDWTHHREAYARFGRQPGLLPVTLLSVGVLLGLASPLLLRGVQYAVYRSNPSDAFLYMSLGETLRRVDWPTILAGVPLTPANLPGVTQLAEASPTALFTARLIAWPLGLNKVALLAWSAELAGASMPRFLYAHHLMAYAVAWPLGLLLGDQLRLPRWLAGLTAAAIVLSFWGRFVLETDAGYEISALPMTLLTVLAWLRLEAEGSQRFASSRFLLALASTAMVSLYLPLALIIGLAFVVYYGLGLLQRAVPVAAVTRHAITVAMAASLLLFTGQLDFLLRAAINVTGRAAGEQAFSAPAMDLLKAEGLTALWGLPGSLLWDMRPLPVRWPLEQLAGGAGLIFTGALALAGWRALQRQAPVAERVVFSVLVGGGLLALFLLATNNDRAAGKTVTYIYPFLIMGLVVFAHYAGGYLAGPGQRVALLVLGGWLAAQVIVALYLPLRQNPNFLTQRGKAEQYEVGALTRYLDQAAPRLVLVDIPRDETWMFPYYNQFVFGNYPAHFQRGLILDNNAEYQTFWLDLPAQPADYAVISKRDDYLGPAQLGQVVAETPDLRLYHLTTTEAPELAARTATYRALEAAKPPFPTLVP